MAIRNWRQRWDPNADLVFNRRVRLGDNPRKPFALPGDKVTKKMRSKFGLNRLRRWFETGIVSLANWTAPEPQRGYALRARAQRERELDERVKVDAQRLRADLESEVAPAAS